MAGSDEEASPTDLAALALGFRTYAETAGSSAPAKLAEDLLRKLVTECWDGARGGFTVPPIPPKLGFLAYRAPALAEPCHAESLALLAGLTGKEAVLLRAGIADRLRREDEANPGDLLLALGAGSAE